jgi:hypothetical protein
MFTQHQREENAVVVVCEMLVFCCEFFLFVPGRSEVLCNAHIAVVYGPEAHGRQGQQLQGY